MPRVTSDNTETPKRAPRRRVAKPKTASSSDEASVATPRRKSPTVLPTSTDTVSTRRKVGAKKYVALGLMVSGLAAAAFIGYSDKGQIDIATVISERNAKLTAGVSGSEGASTNITVPVQNTSNLPDGGLVGSADQNSIPLPPVVEVASTSTSTASTTEEVAPTEADNENPTPEGEDEVEPVIETIQDESTDL